ncbi:DNA-binding transcriptional regulator, MerR family [Actinopolyspora xinjiangensis]|uniref:DNA-binding transcriptional regulator, MerR family n=1 Tax=Actinopolyspora xinjiangensis TaxID=405564 RepID=A0A1H0V9S1_9ACTN|nr:MerR family transcriptional regulator [Actinopolyspora xinjiangensis]SDP74975.1 DNA-binding transcriptional regulator, MerR family [Actinopolyspora xinjiangensis]
MSRSAAGSGRGVGEVARLSGVTVRTLHHYDQIGLLSPSGRSAAGYREYSEADLERLRRILAYRELGFGLTDIADILDGGDTTAHLRRQRRLLTERIDRLRAVLATVELELEANTMGIDLSEEEKFELFGGFDPDEHAEEAQRRWGGTDPYRESRRRTASYTREDWQRMAAEQRQLHRDFATALAEGESATSARATDLAERHRLLISGWFYECSYAMQCSLAAMYLADERFTATYEREIGVGGARFVHDAILANAERARE